MKRTSKKKSAVESVQSPYVLTLELGGTTLIGRGSTILEALQSLQRPTKITTKGHLIIENGSQKRERSLIIPQVKRLFYKTAQPFLAKSFAFGLQ